MAINLILQQNNLKPTKTLFVDDTLENIEAAKALGINTWQIIIGQEDVTDLFDKKIIQQQTIAMKKINCNEKEYTKPNELIKLNLYIFQINIAIYYCN